MLTKFNRGARLDRRDHLRKWNMQIQQPMVQPMSAIDYQILEKDKRRDRRAI